MAHTTLKISVNRSLYDHSLIIIDEKKNCGKCRFGQWSYRHMKDIYHCSLFNKQLSGGRGVLVVYCNRCKACLAAEVPERGE